MEYFGLVECKPTVTTTTPTNYEWINLRNPLPQHTNGQHLQLELRVKFWVPPHLILQDNVRAIFYEQARLDLLEGRLKPFKWTNAAQLAALIAQADKFKFDASALMTVEERPQQLDVTARVPLDVAGGKCKKRRLSRQKSIIELPVPLTIATELISPLTAYEALLMRPEEANVIDCVPAGFLKDIAKEHGKLVNLKMSATSAKYWLLESISKLNGFGEEIFSGRTVSEPITRCDVNVGPHGIVVVKADKQIR